LLLSLLSIPAVISFFKVKKRRERTSPFANSKGYNILEKVASYVTSRPRNTIIVFVAIIVISALSILLLKVSPDSGNILPKEHPYSKGADILDNEFHGSKYISLMISGDIVTPELYKPTAALQKRIESIQGVGGVISITDILVEIGKALNDPGDTLYGKLPPSREMAAQYLELFAINSSPGEIENYLDFDYKNALMTVQYSSPTMKDARSTLRKIYKEVKSSGLEVTVGGYSLIEYQMSRSVVKGQYWSLLFAFAVIFLLLSVIFKSPFAGVLGSLPLLFAVIVTFGFMGLANIELNIVTALISSVSIGLGVDFTIHLFWRIRSESFAGKELREAVITSVTNAGRGIAVNAFSVMAGFSVLFASGFPLIRNFALMIILSLFLCLASALLLVPALTIVIKPKFLTSYKK